MVEQETIWEGPPALEGFLVPIGDLKETEDNPRIGDVDQIALSLKRFGQVRPIALRDDGTTIVAGHHVWKAAKKIGWTHIAAITGHFTDEGEAIAYLLADNRLADLGTMDPEAWIQMAMPMATSGNLEGTGIDMDFYEDILALSQRVEQAAAEVIESTRDKAEDDEMAAERGAMIAAYQQKREVVLLMLPDEYDEFLLQVNIIRQEEGMESRTEAIMLAVEREAFRLNQGADKPGEVVPLREADEEEMPPLGGS